MKKRLWIMAAALMLPLAAWAMSLDEAKSQGLLGEQPNGFLGVVKATPEAVALAQDINQKRREAYLKIAQKNGISLEQVAALAGQKAIERTPKGQYVKTPEGQWLQK
ncbi:YdbL family probable chaperone protein [Gallaecimonas mangrovi]|uniref:YdbL family protein n=1 Tax=Gallaecimonas mangrovi TaxID=2291597 RepID=UPI000E201965|nr:YdbL family protein [Gallaecimonas mangrovi]